MIDRLTKISNRNQYRHYHENQRVLCVQRVAIIQISDILSLLFRTYFELRDALGGIASDSSQDANSVVDARAAICGDLLHEFIL